MSTSGNIYISGRNFYIDGDGYPEHVIPYLRDLVRSSKKFAKRAKLPLIDSILYMIFKENDNIISGEIIKPNYEYMITETGQVYWRNVHEKEWHKKTPKNK